MQTILSWFARAPEQPAEPVKAKPAPARRPMPENARRDRGGGRGKRDDGQRRGGHGGRDQSRGQSRPAEGERAPREPRPTAEATRSETAIEARGRGERHERPERPDRTERAERGERPERSERTERPERPRAEANTEQQGEGRGRRRRGRRDRGGGRGEGEARRNEHGREAGLDTPRAQPVTATGQVVIADSDTNPTVSQAALMTADPPVSTPRMHEPREQQPTAHDEAPSSHAEHTEPYETTPRVSEPAVEALAAQSFHSEPPVREVVPQLTETRRPAEPAYEPPVREPEPPVMETLRPAEPAHEPRAASTSVRPQTFALPPDMVQVETSHAQSPGLTEQPRPEELPRRPRRSQGQAEEPVVEAEPLVQIETRRDGTLDGSQSGS